MMNTRFLLGRSETKHITGFLDLACSYVLHFKNRIMFYENFETKIADSNDFIYLEDIIKEINRSAKERETGIEDRTVGYLKRKINERFAIIIIDRTNGKWAGFSSLEVWNHDKYASNTALIIRPEYRGLGLVKVLKSEIVTLARESFPGAKLFSLTANQAVIKANKSLGYVEVPFSKILEDPEFTEGYESEVDYFGLMRKGFNAEGKYVSMILDL